MAENEKKSKIPTHYATLVSNYKKQDWSEWTTYTELCACYETEKWVIPVKIPKWIIITWTILVLPITDQRRKLIEEAIERKAKENEENADNGDDLPFS